jgi:hypothetical protein
MRTQQPSNQNIICSLHANSFIVNKLQKQYTQRMSQVPLQRLAPGQGQWYIPKNEVDNGFDNYQSISGGGEDTTSDSPVPNQTKSDVQ